MREIPVVYAVLRLNNPWTQNDNIENWELVTIHATWASAEDFIEQLEITDRRLGDSHSYTVEMKELRL